MISKALNKIATGISSRIIGIVALIVYPLKLALPFAVSLTQNYWGGRPWFSLADRISADHEYLVGGLRWNTNTMLCAIRS